MKESLKPVIDFADCDSSIVLQEGAVEIVAGGETYIGTGRAQLDFRPTPHINYYADFNGIDASVAMRALGNLESMESFVLDGITIDGFAITVGGAQADKAMSLKWCPHSSPVDGIDSGTNPINHLHFHLFNFTEYLSTTNFAFESDGDRQHRINFIELVDASWNIRVSSQLETSQRIKQLKADGGFQLTHVASVRRADGVEFMSGDVENLLHMLRYFFSFAKGCWCEPDCPVGFDSSGKKNWSLWSSPSESWRTLSSWFPEHLPSQLEGLFPLFSNLWKRGDWDEALKEVVYWYLSANSSRGIDAGIILTQAALERLSFEFAVKDRKLVLAKGFKDLWASDKFRLLFSSLNIPLEIPAECTELLGMANQNGWVDAPHALTEVRNSLVHPEHKRRGQFQDVMYEAWNLGVWYLEMSMLAVCGFSGQYANRLKRRWKGQYEAVPWAVESVEHDLENRNGENP